VVVGGASVGLERAGYEVLGVDIKEQPEYPCAFRQADALAVDLCGFDLIWASPKCQRYSAMTRLSGEAKEHEDQIAPIRERLRAQASPYIIENVPGAPLVNPVLLCGAMFGLGVVRHRLFECSFFVLAPKHPPHNGSLVTGEYVTVTGSGGVPPWTMKERESRGLARHRPGEYALETWKAAMGIDWLGRKALVQAIPPAYAEFLGKAALRARGFVEVSS
jgi:DNA (cytosine-5)-methyltransferase 1